jgi:DNA-binding LacI/PurR family transcriptional regulator
MSSGAGADPPRSASKKAGLVEVARRLGVSPSTVSNAYNRPDQLSADLRARVLRTAAELGYAGPHPVARSLRTGRAGAVGVIFHDRLTYAFDDPAAVLFLQGLTAATDAEGLAVVLVPNLADAESKGTAVRNAAVDGFVVHGLSDHDALVTATVERRVPTVLVDSPAIDGLDFIGIDDHAAAAGAIEHLLALGHRELGVLSFLVYPNTDGVARRRVAGCRAAVAGAGMAASDLPIEYCEISTVEIGRAAAHALLDRTRCTALFAFSDPLAIGAKLAARERGLSVPADLSIVGFDGTAPATERLTSVHQSQRDKGRLAAERLTAALSADPPAPRHELLPTRLVVGETTARPGRLRSARASVRA